MPNQNYIKMYREPIFQAVETLQATKGVEAQKAYSTLQSLLRGATGNAMDYKDLRDDIIDTLDRSDNHLGAAIIRSLTGLPSKEIPRSQSYGRGRGGSI